MVKVEYNQTKLMESIQHHGMGSLFKLNTVCLCNTLPKVQTTPGFTALTMFTPWISHYCNQMASGRPSRVQYCTCLWVVSQRQTTEVKIEAERSLTSHIKKCECKDHVNGVGL